MRTVSEKQAQEAHDKRQKRFKASDITKVIKAEGNLKSKFKTKGKLKQYADSFKLLISMIKDYAKGNYKKVPWNIIASIGGALLYVLAPVDLIPDFIPGIGYIDDAAVLSICLRLVEADVEKYKKWKEEALKSE